MPDDKDLRPSADALLEEATREHRGKLKIFLGAAPGVGKTYAMLEEAHRRLGEGVDLVVGIAETHGRQETEALLGGLEVLPRRTIEYRGRPFGEMDLDAILERRPRLVLVDELAHTNIPGSRHVKRWQDVDEILDAGIDVYTTLNVQHLESLNDVVERIAGIKVRETLPDGVLQRADEIELIDLPPQELLKRLAEGKVYVPEQARRAAGHFFTPGTLTALREMALRQAAERVDAQMLRFRSVHAVERPWPTRERILVCLADGPSAPRLVRVAKRAAERRGAPWVALYVETHRHAALAEADKDAIALALRLAEQLGGEGAVVQGEDVAREVMAFARARNVSQIIVGRPHPRRRFGVLRPSVTRQVLANSADFDILVVSGGEEPAARSAPEREPPAPVHWPGYLAATGMVAAATAAAYPIYWYLPLPNVSLAYLLAVLLVAVRFGLGPSLYASLASFVPYNFLFTDPRFTFSVSDTQNALTMLFFVVVAVIASNLAARVRAQVEATRTNARRTANLYDFNRRVAAAVGLDDVLWAVVHHVAATVGGASLVLMPTDGLLEVRAGYPPEDRLDDKSMAAAQWAWEHGKRAGRGSATLPATDWLFLPLGTARGAVGVLGVQIGDDGQLLSPEQGRLVDTLADQAALAIERTTLVSDIEAARVASETERLRTALLSSLSHDLRTPLVSILGAASSLYNYDRSLKPAERLELVQTIQEEAERLNRFVQNLLDMTRIGSGALKPRTDWIDLQDVVGAALERARSMLRRRRVRIDLEEGLPILCLDPVLMEQVFFNLIDNACKYSPAGTPVTVWARRRGAAVVVEVCDLGPGIPEKDRERVFDMFYRVEAGDRQTAGTGLGLAICRGIVEAHGGRIRAERGINEAGTCIILTLPLTTPPALPTAGDE
ncbi:sensor histidine kinase [Azospirillum halopraeferens]|uniref:sensor histidine kinase n=1 Tax=Azospirillum halopraeferens TaxID=34010 RepID=UPI00048FE33E|nr:sensor histidine kinase KdpD [Azospirillum halopraeferens]